MGTHCRSLSCPPPHLMCRCLPLLSLPFPSAYLHYWCFLPLPPSNPNPTYLPWYCFCLGPTLSNPPTFRAVVWCLCSPLPHPPTCHADVSCLDLFLPCLSSCRTVVWPPPSLPYQIICCFLPTPNSSFSWTFTCCAMVCHLCPPPPSPPNYLSWLPYLNTWTRTCRDFFIFFILKFFSGHKSFFWGHWYPCFGFLVTSPLGSKPEWVLPYSLLVEANVMYIPQDPPLVLHMLTSWQLAHSQSLPQMHVQRWDLARIRTSNCPDRRRTRYHCASDPALTRRDFVCHLVPSPYRVFVAILIHSLPYLSTCYTVWGQPTCRAVVCCLGRALGGTAGSVLGPGEGPLS